MKKINIIFIALLLMLVPSVFAVTNINSCGNLNLNGETYQLNETITVPDGNTCIAIINDSITLDLNGFGINNFSSATLGAIHVDGRNGTTIKNGYLNVTADAINVTSSNNTLIQNLTFYYPKNAVKITGSINFTAFNNTVQNSSSTAFEFFNGNLGYDNFNVSNNVINKTFSIAIGATTAASPGSTKGYIQNNLLVNGLSTAIQVTSGANNTIISGNTILNTSNRLASDVLGAIRVTANYNSIIANNTINDTLLNGITIGGNATGLQVINNTIIGAVYGLTLLNPTNISYSLNSVYNSSDSCIILSQFQGFVTQNINFTSNTCDNYVRYGFYNTYVANSTNISLTGNTFKNGLAGMYTEVINNLSFDTTIFENNSVSQVIFTNNSNVSLSGTFIIVDNNLTNADIIVANGSRLLSSSLSEIIATHGIYQINNLTNITIKVVKASTAGLTLAGCDNADQIDRHICTLASLSKSVLLVNTRPDNYANLTMFYDTDIVTDTNNLYLARYAGSSGWNFPVSNVTSISFVTSTQSLNFILNNGTLNTYLGPVYTTNRFDNTTRAVLGILLLLLAVAAVGFSIVWLKGKDLTQLDLNDILKVGVILLVALTLIIILLNNIAGLL